MGDMLLRWLLFIILLMGSAARASDPVTGADIQTAIAAALKHQGLTGQAMIHPARHYYPCDHDLIVLPRFEDKWGLLRVTCPDDPAWDITVRVKTRKADQEDQQTTPDAPQMVLALRTALARGDVITADMLAFTPTGQDIALGYFTNPDDVIGRRMAKPLGIGRPLQRRHLETDWMIHEDSPLIIASIIGAIEITANGRALENGQFNDIIEVMNLTSGKKIKAIVKSSKKVATVANMN